MRLQYFIIGILLIGLFAGIIGIFYAGVSAEYGQSYDNKTAGFDKFNEINELSQDMNGTLNNIEQGSTTDLLGSFLGSGYTVVKTSFSSLGLFTEIATTANEEADLGAGSNMVFTIIIAIVGILFFFAVVAILTGRDEV